MKYHFRACAKINWSLIIRGTRPDGYHELDMLMQRISLCDEIDIEPADALSLTVDGVPVPPDDNNLVLKAARALRKIAADPRKGLSQANVSPAGEMSERPTEGPGAAIALRKRIPARAGLGGGSADCAATLRALNALWKLDLTLDELSAIGARLGADVPYCLRDGLCRVRGIGEIIEELPAAPSFPLVLVTPGGGLSTPEVFRAYDCMARGMAAPAPDNAALADALIAGELPRARSLSFNALEAPALNLMPEIGALMQRLADLDAAYVRMSGSGSTVYGVFTEETAAARAAEAIEGAVMARTL